jgi:hypothetical protein
MAGEEPPCGNTVIVNHYYFHILYSYIEWKDIVFFKELQRQFTILNYLHNFSDTGIKKPFGQKEPPLTDHIVNILGRYPDGGQILKV